MKKTILTILICGFLVLGLTGCRNEKELQDDTLKETYNKVEEYFGSEKADRSNLASYSLDESNNVIVVTLIDNSKAKQEAFIKNANISSKYIKFEQGGPYTTSVFDFYITKP